METTDRIIKRYSSRKLYDVDASTYVSLEEVAAMIRAGEHVRIVDNKTLTDVTEQTLMQVITNEHKRGDSLLPTEFLHDVIRAGSKAVQRGVEQLQGLRQDVDNFVTQSIDRINPVTELRAELARLRARVEALEARQSSDPPDA